MSKTLGWKIGIIIAVLVFSVAMFYPLNEKIHLGLDLKGGMHLVFQVETEVAIRKQTDNNVQRLKSRLKELSFKFEKVVRRGNDKIDVIGTLYEDERALRDIFDDEFRSWTYTISTDRITLSLKEIEKVNMRDETVTQALETISNRINHNTNPISITKKSRQSTQRR